MLDALTEAPTGATALVDRAAELASDFASRAAQHDRDGSFPFENFERLREAGLLNVTLPIARGGAGLGLGDTRRIVQQIAAGDASTALVLAMHYLHHAMLARERAWPAATYDRLCRESIEGIALINSLRVEPELGTPARGGLPATTAERLSEGWRISGHKLYATGSPILRWYSVWARTAGSDPLVGNFLVPADAPGARIVETWDHLGMRATGSHDILLEAVEVPLEYAVEVRPPAEWKGPTPLATGWNCLLISSLYHGVARAARDWLVGYLHERVPSNLGSPLASLPRFQAVVGEIEALLQTSERLLDSAAAEIDAGPAPGSAGSFALVKRTVTSNAIRSVEIGLELIGNPGLSRHNPIERHYRDVLCSRIHTPQDDVILANAGRDALKTNPHLQATRKDPP